MLGAWGCTATWTRQIGAASFSPRCCALIQMFEPACSGHALRFVFAAIVARPAFLSLMRTPRQSHPNR